MVMPLLTISVLVAVLAVILLYVTAPEPLVASTTVVLGSSMVITRPVVVGISIASLFVADPDAAAAPLLAVNSNGLVLLVVGAVAKDISMFAPFA